MIELHEAPESLFWWWIAERHAIYLRRQAGLPKPWTDDKILQQYKFTNPFRENDRGTVWLRENFLTPHRNDNLSTIAFNVAWYRMFNWTGTGELLGWQTGWNADHVLNILYAARAAGTKIFTGAHMVRSPFGEPKMEAIVKVCTELYHMCFASGALATICREGKSLQMVYNCLIEVPYVGPFMAYEMVTDMRHTRLLEDASDIMTWANPGPGAQRGLQRLRMPWRPDSDAITSMRTLLVRGNDRWAHPGVGEGQEPTFRLSKDFPMLEMRDIEHSLCEFDKYCRAKFGEGRPRSLYPGV
jgi:hypothetical protein